MNCAYLMGQVNELSTKFWM